MPARFIAIEGLDGSGKETQTRLLKEALIKRGLKVASVSFPQYGKASAAFVEDYLQGGFGEHAYEVNAYAASSFFAMDRLVSYLKGWRKDYEESDVLLADRYTPSNAIHQCSKLPEEDWEKFVTWLFDYEYTKLGLPAPDTVIYLRLDIETSQRLLAKRYNGDASKRDIHERDMGYLERSGKSADWCSKRMGWTEVRCSCNGLLRDRMDVHLEIIKAIGVKCDELS